MYIVSSNGVWDELMSRIFHCLNRLAFFAWTIPGLSGDFLAHMTSGFVFHNQYITRLVEIEAGRCES
jgi:hypothetical protein